MCEGHRTNDLIGASGETRDTISKLGKQSEAKVFLGHKIHLNNDNLLARKFHE